MELNPEEDQEVQLSPEEDQEVQPSPGEDQEAPPPPDETITSDVSNILPRSRGPFS